jgi:hypothetical protein
MIFRHNSLSCFGIALVTGNGHARCPRQLPSRHRFPCSGSAAINLGNTARTSVLLCKAHLWACSKQPPFHPDHRALPGQQPGAGARGQRRSRSRIGPISSGKRTKETEEAPRETLHEGCFHGVLRGGIISNERCAAQPGSPRYHWDQTKAYLRRLRPEPPHSQLLPAYVGTKPNGW